VKRFAFLLLCVVCSGLQAQDTKAEKPAETKPAEAKAADAKPVTMELAGGKVMLKAPAEWKQVKPKFDIINYEFNYPADAKAGEAPVRVTVSGATGGVEANMDRWFTQFTQPDGKSTKDVSKVESFEASGLKVTFVTIPGTFAEMSFGGKPPAKKEKFMMLGGIIETKQNGLLFVKLTGPADDAEKLKDGFVKMLKELEAK
jgi:hypothetical protein